MAQSYWRTVGLVLSWQVAASLCYYSVYAATPFFRDAFGLTRFRVGIVIMMVTFGYAVFLLPLGALTDQLGERRILTIGLIGLSTALLAVAVAPTFVLLLVAAFCLGSLYGTAMPGTNKAIYDNVTAGRQNTAIGIKQVGVTAGSGASALLITGLAGILFWQSGFLVIAGVGLVVAVLFYVHYRSGDTDGSSRRPDFRALLSNRPYRSLVLAGLFLGAAVFTTTGYTVLYVEESIGTSVVFGGVVLALLQIFGSVGRVVMGWLSDVLPGDPQARIGGILLAQTLASVVLFVFVSISSTPLFAAIAFAILGFFVLGLTGIYYSCMATLVEVEEIGSATAGGQLTLTTGGLLAPPVFGYLADAVGYRAGWLFLATGCVVAALLLLQVIRVESTTEQPAMKE
ncbi:MFS transporter [Natrialbaceae archaeon AArc-T1-2]|uniref:MFS transporter n=1 Tax=Natrialbaceae archaeon AArc-T1-2 TaxID=3053904 RepID=UPI00255A939F|nr:MFS transporter [Natrialbaceae archaeon AArc-T1-2]WIV67016.1 MFS transporter [Natrialbaceae archaeon AArc-T1-2]